MNKKLSWSKSPPKVEGYYWHLQTRGAAIIYVDNPAAFKPQKGDEFYGPLPVPAGP